MPNSPPDLAIGGRLLTMARLPVASGGGAGGAPAGAGGSVWYTAARPGQAAGGAVRVYAGEKIGDASHGSACQAGLPCLDVSVGRAGRGVSRRANGAYLPAGAERGLVSLDVGKNKRVDAFPGGPKYLVPLETRARSRT